MGLKNIKSAFIQFNGELINLNNVIGFAKADHFYKGTVERVNKPTLVMQTVSGKSYFAYDSEKERDETFNDLTSILAINN